MSAVEKVEDLHESVEVIDEGEMARKYVVEVEDRLVGWCVDQGICVEAVDDVCAAVFGCCIVGDYWIYAVRRLWDKEMASEHNYEEEEQLPEDLSHYLFFYTPCNEGRLFPKVTQLLAHQTLFWPLQA